MKRINIALCGYYGYGNLGDDILLIVIYSILSKLNPGAKLFVRTNSANSTIQKLIGNKASVLSYGSRIPIDLIVHGGGGTYFDFQANTRLASLIYHFVVVKSLPRLHVFLDHSIRKLCARPRLAAPMRVGVGIGIGTYSRGSIKLLHDLCELVDFNFLGLRDFDSIANLSRLGLSPPISVGSDLAFLAQYWCPSSLFLNPKARPSKRPKVGLILRDWPSSVMSELSNLIKDQVQQLSLEYDITLISLDPSKDRQTINDFRYLLSYAWPSTQQALPEFCSLISQQDVIITSRAHGAICAACLGRPSLILNIEPKLASVHQMLPSCTVLCDTPYRYPEIKRGLKQLLEINHCAIEQDVMRNHNLTKTIIEQALPIMSL